MHSTVEHLEKFLPKDLPKHLLGIGDTPSILECVKHGVDTFDSWYIYFLPFFLQGFRQSNLAFSMPSRYGRHGYLLTKNGTAKIRKNSNLNFTSPPAIPPEITYNSPFSNKFSAALLHHYHKQNEPVGATIGTLHNLYFMVNFMKEIREKIKNNEI